MPKDGLKEACASLKEIYEYYYYPQSRPLPAFNRRPLRAILNPIRKQPAFQLVEE
jgi:hypothetical protein